MSVPTAVLAFALAAAAALLPSSAGAAFPPIGQDILPVTGSVSVSSNLGSETFPVTGTATIDRQDPHMEGAIEVEDMEIVALDLDGTSLIGDIEIHESPSLTSSGEIRALQAGQSYPASSTFDVYIQAIVPANPDPTQTLSNNVPLVMTPSPNQLFNWPHGGITYHADTTPCVPLVPTLPLNECITALSITVAQFVGGEAELSGMRQPEDASRDAPSEISRMEGIVIGLSAVVGVLAVSGAAWYARRNLFR
ncbi:MAG: hypothetical protein WEB04_07735 [Dehalococcoidia bacterium]